MRIVIKSELPIIDKRFVTHLSNFLPTLLTLMDEDAYKKVKKFDTYLRENVFVNRRIYTAKQVLMLGFSNMKVTASGKEGTIEINPTREVPFYNIKIKDACALIDEGNLDIKGTHIIHDLYKYVQDHIDDLRNMYEQGLF